MKKIIFTFLTLSVICFIQNKADAQLLKKLKDKVNQAVDKKTGDATGTSTTDNSSTSSSGSPTNTKGGGLKNTTPPDVNAQINDAEKSQAAASYSDARYSIQQALTGLEIQIGRQVLASLPASANGMNKDTLKNVVMSTQWGWNNLTIQTVYSKSPDKQMTITIGNNTFYSGFASMYFANAGYIQANEKDQNVKQTKVKGYKAIIQYDDSKGYTLMVPLGQSSLIVWECINFATEDEVMAAANVFDIDGIKKMMGEK